MLTEKHAIENCRESKYLHLFCEIMIVPKNINKIGNLQMTDKLELNINVSIPALETGDSMGFED